MSQGQRLLAAIRRRPHTYMELLDLRISIAPWKRVAESLHHLRPGERLVKGTNKRGLVTFAVKRG